MPPVERETGDFRGDVKFNKDLIETADSLLDDFARSIYGYKKTFDSLESDVERRKVIIGLFKRYSEGGDCSAIDSDIRTARMFFSIFDRVAHGELLKEEGVISETDRLNLMIEIGETRLPFWHFKYDCISLMRKQLNVVFSKKEIGLGESTILGNKIKEFTFPKKKKSFVSESVIG